MDVIEKLIEICFREFCDLAGYAACGGELEVNNR